MASLGHPCKFQRVSRLGSVTARHYSSGHQPNFAALNRGRHLYSAGRPSHWALAHILVFCMFFSLCCVGLYFLVVVCIHLNCIQHFYQNIAKMKRRWVLGTQMQNEHRIIYYIQNLLELLEQYISQSGCPF